MGGRVRRVDRLFWNEGANFVHETVCCFFFEEFVGDYSRGVPELVEERSNVRADRAQPVREANVGRAQRGSE
jgi:hypothetical protein